MVNTIISESSLLLSKQKLKIDDLSNKLFEVYKKIKFAEDISILFSNLYSNNSNNINLEKIFKFITENKTKKLLLKIVILY